ncbi:MAG: AmmeMemoRadiSam system protein A [Spirochaetia bacterium]
MIFTLGAADRQILLQTAREAVTARLGQRPPCYPAPTPALSARCGAFVTLKIGDTLRGCIGHITAARPLIDTVREVAQSSAFEDPRFPPLQPAEWDKVSIEISVLSPFERVPDPGCVQVGLHGVLVRRGARSGLLLPQVAAEQGWDREALLTHACRKAGLPGDAWRSPDTQIEVFTAIVFGEKEGQAQPRW